MTNSLNGTSLLNRLRQAVHNKMHGANIFWCWKKVWQVYTMHYIGKSYETTVYKCDDEKIDRFLGQIFSDEAPKKAWQVYTNALHREKLCKHCIQVWRWVKIWSLWKISVTSVYNALYREKLWNHCIQVWRWKNNWPLLGTNIFWWSTKKSVTSVYKCIT